MKTIKQLILVALLLMGIYCGSQYTYTFSSLANNLYQNPTYSLGFIDVNSTITIYLNFVNQNSVSKTHPTDTIINILDSTLNIKVKDFSTETPVCPNALTCTLTYTFTAAGNYYITVFGSAAAVSSKSLTIYELTVLNGANKIVSLTDILRAKVQKLIYFEKAQDVVFSLYPYADVADVLHLFPVNLQTTVISTQIPLTVVGTVGSANSANFTANAAAVPAGYYLLIADVKPYNLVKMIYSSDAYICPNRKDYPDFNSDFLGCAAAASENGLPCINYNSQTGVCSQCLPGYSVVNGSCLANTTCPNRTYYSYGKCVDVSSTCGNYDNFTGSCLTCFNSSYDLVNGFCNRKAVTCAANQYQINYVCYNASSTCATFDPNNGNCLTCIQFYSINGTSCVLTPVICAAGQYVDINRTCQNIPVECTQFDTVNIVCQACIQGYYSDKGVCVKIVCPPGKVPSKYGIFCVDLSPLCATYNETSGECLSCKYSDYTINTKGECVQISSPLAGCQQRQRLGFGACVGAEINCKIYNLGTLDCDTCNQGFYKDYKGLCSQSAFCQSQQWSVNGQCLTFPENCIAVDDLGMCITCSSKDFRLQQGQCVYFKSCAEGQYLNSYGQCVTYSSACDKFNPTDGSCITCKIPGTNPQKGICCPLGQTYNGATCVNSDQNDFIESQILPNSSCKRFHPTTGLCIACYQGYSVDPITMNTCI